MTSIANSIPRRLWVFALLLTFAIQASAAGAAMPLVAGDSSASVASMVSEVEASESKGAIDCHRSANAVASGLHDIHSQTRSMSSSPGDAHANMSCCDSDCQMSMCSSAVAMVNSIKSPRVPALNAIRFSYLETALRAAASSLFRPPILG